MLLLVIDGLGGLPHPDRGLTEMEAARLPHLDALALRSSTGRLSILAPGLTPGSGPGHLSLFGYDPGQIDLGRGVLEALGCDYPLRAGEVAARGNFCSLDDAGVVQDRRAGRPSDAQSRALTEELTAKIRLSAGEFQLLPGKEHRFTLILKGEDLGHHLNDNDPQVEGKAPFPIEGRDARSQKTAAMVVEFLEKSRQILRDKPSATGMLLRGFSARPSLEGFQERYGLRAGVIAVYPMYRGVARLVGMEVLDAGLDLAHQLRVARDHLKDFDFLFIHTKGADTAGHSGDFDRKVEVLEEIDATLPELLDLGADVTMITGDHSTPTIHREHSWHPVPCILHSRRALPVPGTSFSERGVLAGELGLLPALNLMTVALAHAGRLDKYGA